MEYQYYLVTSHPHLSHRLSSQLTDDSHLLFPRGSQSTVKVFLKQNKVEKNVPLKHSTEISR